MFSNVQCSKLQGNTSSCINKIVIIQTKHISNTWHAYCNTQHFKKKKLWQEINRVGLMMIDRECQYGISHFYLITVEYTAEKNSDNGVEQQLKMQGERLIIFTEASVLKYCELSKCLRTQLIQIFVILEDVFSAAYAFKKLP